MTPKARMFTKNQGCQVHFKEHRPTNNNKSNTKFCTEVAGPSSCISTSATQLKGGESLPLEGTHVSLARWKHKKMAITKKPMALHVMLESSSRIWEQVHELRIAGCYPAARIENLSFINESTFKRKTTPAVSTKKHPQQKTKKPFNSNTCVHIPWKTWNSPLFLLASKPKKPIGAVGDTLDIGLSMRFLLYRTRRRTPRLKPMEETMRF